MKLRKQPTRKRTNSTAQAVAATKCPAGSLTNRTSAKIREAREALEVEAAAAAAAKAEAERAAEEKRKAENRKRSEPVPRPPSKEIPWGRIS